MSELSEKISAHATRLEEIASQAASPKISDSLDRVNNSAKHIGRAWSGSWIGYQSRVYYADFTPPPPGAHFSSEWGFQDTFTQESTGDWSEYNFDDVKGAIFSDAGVSSLDAVKQFSKQAGDVFQEAREEFLSIAIVSLENKSDAFLSRLKAQVENLGLLTKSGILGASHPKQYTSRDSLAMSQGLRTPPHIDVLVEIVALKNPIEKCSELAKIMRRAAAHLETKAHHRQEKQLVGTNVFIGHGRSLAWKDLKDFIQDRLGLPWDEFNRVPIAGITNTTRLSEMLGDAAIAFIILTAEDEQADAKMHPRMNVVHEAGLFQGKLGFMKAIILLEEGCEEFSNIHGLGQIHFPKGNIKAVFEEIRRVLEREGLIDS